MQHCASKDRFIASVGDIMMIAPNTNVLDEHLRSVPFDTSSLFDGLPLLINDDLDDLKSFLMDTIVNEKHTANASTPAIRDSFGI